MMAVRSGHSQSVPRLMQFAHFGCSSPHFTRRFLQTRQPRRDLRCERLGGIVEISSAKLPFRTRFRDVGSSRVRPRCVPLLLVKSLQMMIWVQVHLSLLFSLHSLSFDKSLLGFLSYDLHGTPCPHLFEQVSGKSVQKCWET